MKEDGDGILKQATVWTENFSTIWEVGDLTEEHVHNSSLAKNCMTHLRRLWQPVIEVQNILQLQMIY